MKQTKPILVVHKPGPKPRLGPCANGCPRRAYANALCNPCYQRSRLPVLTEERAEEVVKMAATMVAADIAAKTGLPITVVRQLTRHLPPPRAEPEEVACDPEETRRGLLVGLMQNPKPDPMKVAETAFGSRLEQGACLKLDGVPVNYFELMRRANKELRRYGLPLLTACEAWMI